MQPWDDILVTLPDLFKEIKLQATDISYLAQGANNVVFSMSALTLKGDKYVPDIIRISKHPTEYDQAKWPSGNDLNGRDMGEACKRTATSAWIQMRVQEKLPKLVPQIIYCDPSTNNACRRPYTIQRRAPGKPLAEVIDSISIDNLKKVFEQLAIFKATLESFKFPLCGNLETVYESTIQLRVRSLFTGHIGPSSGEAAVLRLDDECRSSLKRQIELGDMFSDSDKPNEVTKHLRQLSHLLTYMVSEPKFQAALATNMNEAHLHHPDLHARNIIVDTIEHPEGRVAVRKVTILDFDNMQAMPLILSRRHPPFIRACSHLHGVSKVMKSYLREYEHCIEKEFGRDARDEYAYHAERRGAWVAQIAATAFGRHEPGSN